MSIPPVCINFDSYKVLKSEAYVRSAYYTINTYLIFKGDGGFNKSSDLLKKPLDRLFSLNKPVNILVDTSKKSAITELSKVVEQCTGKLSLRCAETNEDSYCYHVDGNNELYTPPIFVHDFRTEFYRFLVTDKMTKVVFDSSATLDEGKVFRALSTSTTLVQYNFIVKNLEHLSKIKILIRDKVRFKVLYFITEVNESVVDSFRGLTDFKGNKVGISFSSLTTLNRTKTLKNLRYNFQNIISKAIKQKKINREQLYLRFGAQTLWFKHAEKNIMLRSNEIFKH